MPDSLQISPGTTSSTRHFLALDGMRGIAAIFVAIFHFRGCYAGYDNWPSGDGYLAVNLFFSLSGFVLGHAYLTRLSDGMTFSQFMKARLIRLYPLYFLGLIVAAVAMSFSYLPGHHHDMPLKDFLSSLFFEIFMLPSWPPALDNSLFLINPVAWSLFFEMLLSLLFAIFWKWINARSLSAVIGILGSIVIFVSLQNRHTISGNHWDTAVTGAITATLSFSIGLLIHRFYKTRKFRVEASPGVFLASVGVLSVYLLAPVNPSVRSCYDLFFILILSPLLLIIGTSKYLGGRWIKCFSFLGSTSYALYVLHYPLLIKMFYGLEKWHGSEIIRQYNVVAATGFVMCMLCISYAVDLVYDSPVRRFLTKCLNA